MKVALIGAGGIGGVHSGAYSSIPDVKLIAVVDLDIGKANKIAQIYGANVYTSVDEMLVKERPDMVDICTPTYLHAEMAVKCMQNRVHVLCEKPISTDLKSANEMLEASIMNNVFFMIAHVVRFFPEYIFLKKIYDGKDYGRLKRLLLSRTCERPRWSWDDWMLVQDKSGRAPLDIHIHDADYLLYLLGKPKAVKSFGMEKDNVISYITTHYIYDDLLVDAEGGWYASPIPFEATFRAIFENAVLDFRNGKLMLYPVDGEAHIINLEDGRNMDTGINITSVNGYYNEIEYFIECIRSNTPPEIITPQETIECLEMVLKEFESVKTGETINIT